MRNYDPWAITLVVLAFASVPAALVLPWIGVFAARRKTTLVFAAYLGACGLLALGIAALSRAVVGPSTHAADYHGMMVFASAIAIPTFGAACVLVGRAMTEQRVWKVIGSAFLVGLGADAAFACLAVHQFLLANSYNRASEPGWIIGALLGGIPLALIGLGLLAMTSARATDAAKAPVAT